MSHLPADALELASRVQFNFFETPALFQVKLPLIALVLDSGETGGVLFLIILQYS